jgi:hypothetical protein
MFRLSVLLLSIALMFGCAGGSGNSDTTKSGDGSGSGSTSCSSISTGVGASLGGFVPFPASSAWNQDISASAVDPSSATIIAGIGTSAAVHADFGSGLSNGSKIGIPYVVVDGSQALVPISFTAYGSESDPGPMPIPPTGPIEGDPAPGTGDRHVLVLNKDNCFLYEMYSAYPAANNSWTAGSAAVWDMTANTQRVYTWTSADAAGLPIFPGLVRYDEVASGKIQHALRFTLSQSRAAFVAPASHFASFVDDPALAPMGMRMRLKAGFDTSGYSAANQVILKALKQYGMIMADNGSSMYISGVPDERWDNNDLHQLGNLKASDFEVVQMGTVYTASNIPSGAAPSISSFTATPTSTTSSGTVTLNWSATNSMYYIVSPDVGAVRGTSVIVKPATTTSYYLYATNQYGRAVASVTVTVQ